MYDTRAMVSRRQPSPHLTDREKAVLVLLARGLHNKEIARRLGVSQETVKTHITNVFSKFGFSTRAQAAAWWTATNASVGPSSEGEPDSPEPVRDRARIRSAVGPFLAALVLGGYVVAMLSGRLLPANATAVTLSVGAAFLALLALALLGAALALWRRTAAVAAAAGGLGVGLLSTVSLLSVIAVAWR